MQYLEFLARVHELLAPRSYFEIGVRNGHSMALSRSRSVGIDPAYAIAEEVSLGEGVTLHMETSDDYFAGDRPAQELDGGGVDLAFIDGMHLFEFSLRDFLNTEKHLAPGAVVVFDDMLPRTAEEAFRDRQTRAWTGDVWKVVPALREARPDLILILVRTTPTGLLLVLGGDPDDTSLAAAYPGLEAKHMDSGEEPPAEFLERTTAVYPTHLLDAPIWDVLRGQRERGVSPADGRAELLASLQGWASTALNDKQAKAIHPSLKGRPKKKAAAPKKAAPKGPQPWTAKRVVRGIRRRLPF